MENYNMSDETPFQKRCPKCGEIKPLDAFHKDKTKKDGQTARCKACIARHYATNAEAIGAYQRAYRAANIDKIREDKRTYRAANIEKIKAHKRAYYAANAQTINERHRTYRTANVEARREYRRVYNAANAEAIREQKRVYRAANIDHIREKDRAYYANIVQAKLKHDAAYAKAKRDYIRAHRAANPDLYRAATHRRLALIKGNGGSFTTQELMHMRLTQGGFCAYCQYQHDPDALTIDHIIPITQGGRHEAANICLACPRCNYSKHDRTPDQWLNRWYYSKNRSSDDADER